MPRMAMLLVRWLPWFQEMLAARLAIASTPYAFRRASSARGPRRQAHRRRGRRTRRSVRVRRWRRRWGRGQRLVVLVGGANGSRELLVVDGWQRCCCVHCCSACASTTDMQMRRVSEPPAAQETTAAALPRRWPMGRSLVRCATVQAAASRVGVVDKAAGECCATRHGEGSLQGMPVGTLAAVPCCPARRVRAFIPPRKTSP